jgi:hypothetical protein
MYKTVKFQTRSPKKPAYNGMALTRNPNTDFPHISSAISLNFH